jgi:hypothetical protein
MLNLEFVLQDRVPETTLLKGLAVHWSFIDWTARQWSFLIFLLLLVGQINGAMANAVEARLAVSHSR